MTWSVGAGVKTAPAGATGVRVVGDVVHAATAADEITITLRI
jgi:hypothetical protein